MSNSEIIAKTFELREKLLNSDLYEELKIKEKNMLEDDNCFKLLSSFQVCKEKYNDAKRFEKYGGNVEKAAKDLSALKKELSDNEFVEEYNVTYKKMLRQLKNIENIIYKDIIKKEREIEIE